MKQSKITRVVQILTTLQAGRANSVGETANLFATSRRTIFRDLKELQTIGVPYRHNARTGGYTMDPPRP
jgi:predicted DNA-binding transcriptional regulator YafY